MTYSAFPDALTAPHNSTPVARHLADPTEHHADIGRADSFVSRVQHALDELRAGRLVIVSDDHDREDEADLIMAAEKAGHVNTAFMIRHTSGVLCAAITPQRATELDLPLMVDKGDDPRGTAFTVSVDLKGATTTGISAADRAATLRAIADPEATAGDFSRPGHIFPLRARPGGVLSRPGHTESAVDLCTLADLRPAGVLCELVNDDGTMMRGTELAEFADRHQLVRISVAEIARYRRITQTLVHRAATARLPTEHGEFTAIGYRSLIDDAEHLVLVRGEASQRTLPAHSPVPVRIHAECTTGDIFLSRGCGCHQRLQESLHTIAAADRGVVIYLRPHDRKRRALAVDRPYLVSDSDSTRPYPPVTHSRGMEDGHHDLAGQILRELGISHVSLPEVDAEALSVLADHGLRVTVEERLHDATGT